jgi:hypothetical protein
MESIASDKSKDLQIFLEVLDRKIHKAIDLQQIVVFTAELIKENFQNAKGMSITEIMEMLESISSKGMEAASRLQELRKYVKEGLLPSVDSTPKAEQETV